MNRLRLALSSVVCGIAFVLVPAIPASAHADLKSSSPAPSAILEQSPRDIVLDFSEPVSTIERSVELFDQRRQMVEIPDPTQPVADRIEIRDLPNLDSGLYLVVWRALSEDGHIAQGSYTFQIGVGSPGISAEELVAGIDVATSPTGLDIVRHSARVLMYLGLAAALGTLAFSVVTRQPRLRWVVLAGWVGSAIGSIIQLVTQVVYASGSGWSSTFDSSRWSDVLSTRLGQGIAVRLGLLGLLFVLLVIAWRQEPVRGSDAVSTTWWRSATAVVGGGIVATYAATGHPSASSMAAVASAIDAVHLAAIFLWLGGLLAILVGDRDHDVVRTFSRVATFALPIAVVTGVWQTWHLLDSFDDITAHRWGRAFIIKVSLVVVVAMFAMVARWIVNTDHLSPLRRLVGIEVCAALVIVGSTSVMVSAAPQVKTETEVVSLSLVQEDIIANVTVTPGGIGSNEIHVTVMTPGGTLDPVESLGIRMTLEQSDLPAVTVDVETLGPNHFVGSVAILQSGTWSLELLVKVSPSRVVRLSTSIDI